MCTEPHDDSPSTTPPTHSLPIVPLQPPADGAVYFVSNLDCNSLIGHESVKSRFSTVGALARSQLPTAQEKEMDTPVPALASQRSTCLLPPSTTV